MQSDYKPLFSLTIEEFTTLTRDIVDQAIAKNLSVTHDVPPETNHEDFNIDGLMGFLKCSKASIHNYKKRGLPFYRVGRKLIFRKSEVLDFMKRLRK